MSQVFTLTGITGNVGSHLANHLLAAGHKVRGVVRDPNSQQSRALQAKGVELVTSKLTDSSSLCSAFKGSDVTFIMVPPLFTSQEPLKENTRMVQALKSALVESKVPRIVVLSSVAAHLPKDSGIILKVHELEQELNKISNIDIAHVRAGYFNENTLMTLPLAKEQSIFPTFIKPEIKLPFISTFDIGAVAAKLMMDDTWKGRRILELEGPERYSYEDIANYFSKFMDTDIAVVTVPEEQAKAAFRNSGFSEKSAELMAETIKGYNAGYLNFEGNQEALKGKETYDMFLQRVFNREGRKL